MSLWTQIFRHETSHDDAESQRVYAQYTIARTFVDFAAGACFLIGSIMMFWSSLDYASTWLFVIGSVLFAAKPTITLLRELKLYRLGEIRKLNGEPG